jgi:hypothetical protein
MFPSTVREVSHRLVLGLLLGAALLLAAPIQASAAEINCKIQTGSCEQTVQDRRVRLNILPKPVEAMQELTFRVSVSGAPLPEAPFIDLGMPGMEMGPNEVSLEQVNATAFEGQGVIVRCPSGKRTWKATVVLPEAGQAEFVFDVVY